MPAASTYSAWYPANQTRKVQSIRESRATIALKFTSRHCIPPMTPRKFDKLCFFGRKQRIISMIGAQHGRLAIPDRRDDRATPFCISRCRSLTLHRGSARRGGTDCTGISGRRLRPCHRSRLPVGPYRPVCKSPLLAFRQSSPLRCRHPQPI